MVCMLGLVRTCWRCRGGDGWDQLLLMLNRDVQFSHCDLVVLRNLRRERPQLSGLVAQGRENADSGTR